MILPPPGEGFEWRETAVAPVLVCRPLEAVAPHLFTTQGFMLGAIRTGEEPWRQLAETLAAGPLLRLRQVHGRTVYLAGTTVPSDPPEADIVLSGSDGPAVAVQGADCVPLLLADARLGVIAAAHAGWRGLALGVPREAVAALGRRFGSRPEDLIAAIGPSVGACCYEVGPEVRTAFAATGFTEEEQASWFHRGPRPTPTNVSMAGLPSETRSGHAYFDGWACASAQLSAAGVRPSAIYCAALCTASHPGLLCSYRRDRASAGRIAGAIAARPHQDVVSAEGTATGVTKYRMR